MVTPGVPPIPHVGGPILTPSCPTVIVVGMPIAGAGSLCACVGPPDTLAMCSTTVLAGGAPAGRMLDQTAHNGMVTVGAPTVLVG
jgi:uncharacterized Zn-binding protein involved in type VI secretion